MSRFLNLGNLRCVLAAATTFASICLAGSASAVVLYDGAAGSLPAAQGWIYVTNPLLLPDATQTAGPNFATLDTTPDGSEQAGYFTEVPSLGAHPAMPLLDRAMGYNVRFDVRVASETHSNNDRAGFSVIALSDDSRGVEIGFWENEIWTQNDTPLFTHGEGVAHDTTLAVTRYDLTVSGNQYSLAADGAMLLSGSLRDYTAFSGPFGAFPYDSSSFLFFGDDTSSAAAAIELARVEVTALAVPEPATMILAMFGLIMLISWLRRFC